MSERFLLYIIDDGEWHTITKIAEELEWPTNRVIEVTKYLAQGRFIHYDEQTANVKLQSWVKKFPRGEWGKSGKCSIGTVTIPPDGNVTLQKTVIHNCLETEIEADFMIIDENLVELLVTKSKQNSQYHPSETSPEKPYTFSATLSPQHSPCTKSLHQDHPPQRPNHSSTTQENTS